MAAPEKLLLRTRAGERNQARQTLRFYRLLFSHPSVEAITWWDLHDPSYSELSGLLRSDLSPKPRIIL